MSKEFLQTLTDEIEIGESVTLAFDDSVFMLEKFEKIEVFDYNVSVRCIQTNVLCHIPINKEEITRFRPH